MIDPKLMSNIHLELEILLQILAIFAYHLGLKRTSSSD